MHGPFRHFTNKLFPFVIIRKFCDCDFLKLHIFLFLEWSCVAPKTQIFAIICLPRPKLSVASLYWTYTYSVHCPCPSTVSLQYICSVSAVSTSCALDRPAVHKGYHLKSEQCMSSTLYLKWSAVLQEKYYVLRVEVSFEVQGSMFWSAAKYSLCCTGIALQTDMGGYTDGTLGTTVYAQCIH